MIKYGMATTRTNDFFEVTSRFDGIISTKQSESKATFLSPATSQMETTTFNSLNRPKCLFAEEGEKDTSSEKSLDQVPKNQSSELWKVENNLVMSWLINFITNDISENVLLYGTTHEICEAAKEFYLSKENTSKISVVESSLHDLQ